MAETIFVARNLTKRYRRETALAGFHMEIRRGDIYGFVGRNGAGKTTLMRILTGMVRQTGGDKNWVLQWHFGETGSSSCWTNRSMDLIRKGL